MHNDLTRISLVIALTAGVIYHFRRPRCEAMS
jgi:hypothetical protein